MKIKLIIFCMLLFFISTPLYADKCECKILVEYKVINIWHYEEFVTEINKLIKEGWIPQGGVSIAGGYQQAMIKKVQREVYEDVYKSR